MKQTIDKIDYNNIKEELKQAESIISGSYHSNSSLVSTALCYSFHSENRQPSL